MKTIIFLLYILLLSCSNQKPYFTKVDGSTITKKQFDRANRKSIKKAWNQLNKEEQDLLRNTEVKFNYN